MKRVLRVTALVLLFAMWFAARAHPHGGGFSAPAPGPSRTDSAPPPSQVVAITASGDLFDSWEFWWQVNRDRFLDLKGRQLTAQIRTGGPAFPTGRGTSHSPTSVRERLQRDVQHDVIPALLSVLEQGSDGDTLAALIIATARSAEGAARNEVLNRAVELLAHPESDVQTSAAISMGVLGERRATRVLIEVASDSSMGRMLVGGQQPSGRLRAFAALGLGMLARPEGIDTLSTIVRGTADSERELKWGAITALGLLPHDHPSAPTVCALLLEQLEVHSLDDMLRASAVLSLGRLGRLEALPAVISLVRAQGATDNERRSAIIALGLFARVDHERALSALQRCLKNESDRPSRHFAIIALAEIGARDRRPQSHPETHKLIFQRLSRELAGKGRSQGQRPWAALGAAIYGRSQAAAREAFIEGVREGLDSVKDPSARSAFVLAAALLGDGEVPAELAKLWRKTRDDRLRGYIALALGMLDDKLLVEEFRALLVDETTLPAMRQRIATALGLLRDSVSTDLLIESLASSTRIDLRAAATRGLALLGESRSLGALVELTQRHDTAGQVRAFAGVALGLLGERTDLPWNEPLRAHCNYLLGFSTLNEVLGLF